MAPKIKKISDPRPKRRAKRTPLDEVARARKARYKAILKRDAAGLKVTAVERRFLEEYEAEIAREKVAGTADEEPTTLEEDLEEWVLRDGVVRGRARRLSGIAAEHGVERASADKKLIGVQRRLLARYGFESRRTGGLSGNEALALQWVKSIGQIARVSAEWELQMDDAEQARAAGQGMGLDRFGALVATLKQLTEKRDGLALKVRELSVREQRQASGKKAAGGVTYEVVVADGLGDDK